MNVVRVSILSGLVVACSIPVSAEVLKDAKGGVTLVARDAAGKVTSQRIVNPDGTQHLTQTAYWPKQATVSRTVDEDLGRDGRPMSRVTKDFDRGGREREQRAVTIDATGREHGTSTRVIYDDKGQAHRSTTAVER